MKDFVKMGEKEKFKEWLSKVDIKKIEKNLNKNECYIMSDNRIETERVLGNYFVKKRKNRILMGELNGPVIIRRDLPNYMRDKSLRELIDVQDEKLISIIHDSEEILF